MFESFLYRLRGLSHVFWGEGSNDMIVYVFISRYALLVSHIDCAPIYLFVFESRHPHVFDRSLIQLSMISYTE